MYDHARLFVRVSSVLTQAPGASLQQLARGLRIHPHTLAQVISAHTGTSFSAWRRGRRIAEACALLRTRPDLSIKEVAAAAGFNSTSVFDRFLRRACGLSPSEYRTQARNPLVLPAHESGAADSRLPHGFAPAPCSNVNVLDIRSTEEGAQHPTANGTLESSTASF